MRLVGINGRLEKRPGNPSAQLYLRADRQRLTYVPLDQDEAVSQMFDVETFRTVFRLDIEASSPRQSGDAVHWQDFLRDARVLQDDLIGRVKELNALKAWIKGRDTRQEGVAAHGWVLCGPGLGKSLLMAKAAADLGSSKREQQGFPLPPLARRRRPQQSAHLPARPAGRARRLVAIACPAGGL